MFAETLSAHFLAKLPKKRSEKYVGFSLLCKTSCASRNCITVNDKVVNKHNTIGCETKPPILEWDKTAGFDIETSSV